VSNAEHTDLVNTGEFRTAENTLEGKQFFKSEQAVKTFVHIATIRNYQPPYRYLVSVWIDEFSLQSLQHDEMILDDFEAISIAEADLPSFNNIINFDITHEF
jgi:hypothetical protein